jgi:prepilin-type N-terminal cleavage/methylation domain-containing protein
MAADNATKETGKVQRNFTLVEILAVMGLMAILLFMALPAFEKIAKGGGVEIAARTLSGKLGTARGYAINNRQYVALLMPDADLPNDYLFRSYKLCVVSSTYDQIPSSSPPIPPPYIFTFIRWIPSETWGFLPTGAAINHINGAVHSGSADGTGTFLNPAKFPFEQVKNVKLSEISSAYASVDNVRAIVFRPNGKLAGASGSRYVAVSESTYSFTSLVSTNPKNWIDITIDQYTGRVTYGAE